MNVYMASCRHTHALCVWREAVAVLIVGVGRVQLVAPFQAA
ncbi:hypothetical protein [Alysiella filiformis]|nr:hypothetical protein [Alysiella filiformis]